MVVDGSEERRATKAATARSGSRSSNNGGGSSNRKKARRWKCVAGWTRRGRWETRVCRRYRAVTRGYAARAEINDVESSSVRRNKARNAATAAIFSCAADAPRPRHICYESRLRRRASISACGRPDFTALNRRHCRIALKCCAFFAQFMTKSSAVSADVFAVLVWLSPYA